ncbi:MAG: rRNA maturation RNase YbeY [Flavobacteriales bacterium]
MAIHFHSVDIDHALKHKNAVKRWIIDCVSRENLRLKDLNIMFCSDENLLEINRQFLNHDYYTDIITFNYNSPGYISGELYISIPRVQDNALKFQSTELTELYRVIIHGVMHLCGYNDKTKKDAEIMRKKEDDCLSIIAKFK